MTSTATDRAAVATDVAIKTPCRVTTTANITLSGTQTIDGVAVVAGDRVLVKNQTTQTENGIYVVSATAWTRSIDFDGLRDIAEGTLIFITHGTSYAQTLWGITTVAPVIGTSNLTFAQLAAISNGTYLPLSGGTLTGGLTGTTLTLSGALAAGATTLSGALSGTTGSFSGTLQATTLNVTGSSAPAAGVYLQASNTVGISARSLPSALFTNPASAVNYFSFTGAATGNPTTISFIGSDSNVSAVYATKGTGDHTFQTGAGSYTQLIVLNTTTAVNYMTITGNGAGGPPQLAVAGADADIDLYLLPKNNGVVRFGTRTASSDVAITGYITIKDGGGTTRKLAVIA